IFCTISLQFETNGVTDRKSAQITSPARDNQPASLGGSLESDVAISTRDLTKTNRSVEALSGLNLEVRRNSIFGFLGPNGAGKTTTIKLLLGLVRPTRGNATLFGMDLAHDSLSIRRRIGYLAQDPRYYDYMTARQTVRFTAGFFY